jgi:hypothetical protein
MTLICHISSDYHFSPYIFNQFHYILRNDLLNREKIVFTNQAGFEREIRRNESLRLTNYESKD